MSDNSHSIDSTNESHKRKAAEDAPSSGIATKKGKTSDEKQQTIEQTMNGGHESTSDKPSTSEHTNGHQNGDKSAHNGDNVNENHHNTNGHHAKENSQKDEKSSQPKNEESNRDADNKQNGKDDNEIEAEKPSEKKQDKDDSPQAAHKNAIKVDKDREESLPSSVLEKGIIYFFTRGRVGVDNVESAQDLQRSHFVLRPIPDGSKIGDGSMIGLKNNRLMALPKKVWPKSGKDKFMAFVEKSNASVDELKEFFAGSEYSTKTVGVRQSPPVTPVGEGVYAITSSNGRENYLTYMLTIPQEIGELQKDIGIAEKGGFVISLKNPESKGPAYATLPQKADFPKEFIAEFSGRGWMPAEPKHLDYANAQILLIGSDVESSGALRSSEKDQKNDKKTSPDEVLEELEHEDSIRVQNMKGDDTIYADLGISKKDYPDVPTTW